MLILAAAGYRRWLFRPWQWSLRDYMVIVAVCAVGLLVSGSPAPIIVFLTVLAGAVYACLRLARHGFKLADVATLLAIILLTAAIALLAMERVKNGALGANSLPFNVSSVLNLTRPR
jgi:hypothetical protein